MNTVPKTPTAPTLRPFVLYGLSRFHCIALQGQKLEYLVLPLEIFILERESVYLQLPLLQFLKCIFLFCLERDFSDIGREEIGWVCVGTCSKHNAFMYEIIKQQQQ